MNVDRYHEIVKRFARLSQLYFPEGPERLSVKVKEFIDLLRNTDDETLEASIGYLAGFTHGYEKMRSLAEVE